ncbi:MAG: hypothetical protein M1829_000995 [Trizodia sp. TS-e1964]|nr:MAG: hypothetical protein M1829_000995 [Trizodia sp. TS-e1964]
MRLEIFLFILASSFALAAPGKKGSASEGEEIPDHCNSPYKSVVDCYNDPQIYDNTDCFFKYRCSFYNKIGADAGMVRKAKNDPTFAARIPPNTYYYQGARAPTPPRAGSIAKRPGRASSGTGGTARRPASTNQRQNIELGVGTPLNGKIHRHKVTAGQ